MVVVSVGTDGPRLVLCSFLETAAAGDRLALEPYGAAAAMAVADAAAAVAEGRRRQDEMAAHRLQEVLGRHRLARAALLVNRAGWVTDLLSYSREWPAHVPVAEGLAVREALRFGIGRCGLDLLELDEKSLPEQAAAALGLGAEEIDARLKALGQAAGRPWRKEQKLACLAAWVAAA